MMRPRVFSLVLALAPVVGVAVPTALCAQSGQGQIGLALGSTAPAVALEDLDGNAVQLADVIDGKPAVLEFWATWCEQCEALQPELDAVQAQFGEQVQVIAIAVAVAQSQRRVRRHLEQHDPGYPYLWDADGEAVRAFEAPTTAVVIVLDSDGTVAYSGVGGDQDLVSVVAGLLSGH